MCPFHHIFHSQLRPAFASNISLLWACLSLPRTLKPFQNRLQLLNNFREYSNSLNSSLCDSNFTRFHVTKQNYQNKFSYNVLLMVCLPYFRKLKSKLLSPDQPNFGKHIFSLLSTAACFFSGRMFISLFLPKGLFAF